MPLSADKHFGARIVERRDLSPDLWLLRLEPDAPFKFLAGQYATLGVERNGKKIERPYSIVSSPYEQTLEFFVELVPHGEFTPLLHMLKQGDTLLCRKIAKGRFTLDLRSGRTQHLLVSTVTGIAPFVSYVRTLYRGWKDGTFVPGNHKLYCLQAGQLFVEFIIGKNCSACSEVPWFHSMQTVAASGGRKLEVRLVA
jgi:ferredoxin--NADP+ reductase